MAQAREIASVAQRIGLPDSPQAGGDGGTRSGGNDHVPNSLKAGGLPVPEDGDAFQRTVRTRSGVCTSRPRKALPARASCKIRRSESTGLRGFRMLVPLQAGLLLLMLFLMAALIT